MKPIATVLILTITAFAEAKIVEQTVDYKDGQTALKGFLAYDDSGGGKRPGVVIFPEWWGLNDYVRGRARQLAELGYVAFVADMYGEGKSTTSKEEAGKWSGETTSDKAKWRARANAAYDQLASNANVDKSKLAAIGYCFGGSTALQLAYSGADLAGIVSFHGNPAVPNDEDSKRVKARLLVLHGANDPMVTDDVIAKFLDACRKAKLDCQIVSYVGAVHAFTNPNVDKAGIPGAAYNASADKRSWQAMRNFFDEIFGAK